MKRFLAAVTAVSIALFLSSCDIVKPVSELDPDRPSSPSGNTEHIEPAADPSDPLWDWGYDASGLGESWYRSGDTSKDFFTVQPDEEGIENISFFDAGAEASPGNSSCECSFILSSMHMLNEEGAEKEFDFIFTDPFTAFDAVSGEYYLRGDYVSLYDDLTSHSFRSTIYPDEYIVLHGDGTAEDFYEGTSYPGSWYVENAHRLVYHDSETGSDLRFFYSYTDEGEMKGLYSSAGELWEAFDPSA